jgi:hypothetical protein
MTNNTNEYNNNKTPMEFEGGSTDGHCLKRKRPVSSGLCEADGARTRTKHIIKSISLPPNLGGQSMMTAASKKRHQVANPQRHLESILLSKGSIPKVRSFDSIPNFFHELKQEEVDAYGLDVLRAVRESDLDTLRQYHIQGRPLKCSNRFGESLLHLACRKGLVSVVDFLVNEAKIPLCVKDDMGRTPLADAFWTIEPNSDIVDIILRKCPDLLLVSDKRGHPPLAYARREHWSHWNKYLDSRSELLTPKILDLSEES